MPLLHNVHTITVERASLLFETDNPRYLLRVGTLPRSFMRRYKDRFIREFNELFSEKELTERVGNGLRLLKLMNRAYNLLPSIQRAVLLCDDDSGFEAYQRYFHRPLKTVKDYGRIESEIERLKLKIEELKPKEDKAEEKRFSLEDIVSNVESILGYTIDRKMKLYAFKIKYDHALRKAREYEKNKMKRG